MRFVYADTKTNWFALDDKIRFLIVGLANTGVRYLIFAFLTFFFTALHYQFSLFLSWMLSSFTAFLAYKILVFETEGNHLKEYLKSILTWTISYILNAFLLELLVSYLGLNVLAAQALALTVITVNNYLLFKHFAFKKEKVSVWKKWLSVFK